MIRLLVAGLFGGFALSNACSQSAADLFAGGLSLKGGVFALYNGNETEPATVVRLDKLYKAYERKGFFRIGILPIGVMEGVTFEVQHRESVTNSLLQLHEWLGPRSTKRLELRRVCFLVSAPVTNRLETARARLTADGKLALFDGVSFVSGTNQIGAARGTLQITGQQAGRVVMKTSPPWTNNLFGGFATPEPSNKPAL